MYVSRTGFEGPVGVSGGRLAAAVVVVCALVSAVVVASASGNGEAQSATVPAMPSGLSAVVGGSSSVVLSWSDPGDDSITGYQYQLSKGPTSLGSAVWGSWTSISGSGAGTVSYKVTGLDSGTYYLFRVRAQNANGNSRASDAVSAFTTATTTTTTMALPAMPSGLSAVVGGSSSVVLSWSDPGDDSITGYQYQLSKGPTSLGSAVWGSWTSISGSGAGTVSYKVTGLDSGTRYFFRVRAQNANGNSQASDAVAVYTTTMALPAMPSGLSAVVGGSSSVVLSWSDPGDDSITGYQYQLSKNPVSLVGAVWGSWTSIPGSGTVSYTVTGLDSGTRYFFRVRAQNANGNSQASAAVAVYTTTLALPAMPSGLSAVVGGSSSVVLSWSDPGDNSITGYQYQLSKNPVSLVGAVWGSWTSIPGSGSGTVSYTVTGLDSGTRYFFRVRAQNSNGNSRASDAVSADTNNPGSRDGVTPNPVVLPPRVHLPGDVGSSATDTRVAGSRSVMAVVRVVVGSSVSVGGSSWFRDPDGAYLGSDPSVGAVLATSFRVSAVPVDGSAAACRFVSTRTRVEGNGTFTRNDDRVVAYLSVVKEAGPSGRVCRYDVVTGLPVGFVAASEGSTEGRVGSYVLSPAAKLVAGGVVATSAADCGKRVVVGLGVDGWLGSSDDVKAVVAGPLCLTHSVKVAKRGVYVTQSVTGDPGGGSARYSFTEGRSCGTSGHATSPSVVTLHEGYFNISESVLGTVGAESADGRFGAARHALNYQAEPCVVTVAVSDLPQGCATAAATQKRNLATSQDAENRVVIRFDITCPNTAIHMTEDTHTTKNTVTGPPTDTPTG